MHEVILEPHYPAERPAGADRNGEFLDFLAAAQRAIEVKSEPSVVAGDGSAVPQREPRHAIKDHVSLQARRDGGVFFTSSDLATDLWRDELDNLSNSSVVYDPACGAADLLLPAQEQFAVAGLSHISERALRGSDIQPALVQIAKMRLAASDGQPPSSKSEFPGIEARDFFDSGLTLSGVTHVVMNPPFNSVQADDGCSWAKGRVNNAARFVLHALQLMDTGACLLAILPDVLRSGSNYRRWRSEVLKYASIERVEPREQFDASTDVHVFVLTLRRGYFQDNPDSSWLLNGDATDAPDSGVRLDSEFQVRVGPVVPHRDNLEGPDSPYFIARGLDTNSTFAATSETRKYAGRLEEGPFLLVKRTSRPGDQPRIKAVVVASTGKFAVENHLLVIRPNSGTLESCLALLFELRSTRITNVLNHRIRLRHLTVGCIKELAITRGMGNIDY